MFFPHPLPARRLAWCAFASWLVFSLSALAQGPSVTGTLSNGMLPTRTVVSGAGEQLDLNTVFHAQDAPATVVQLAVVITGSDLTSGTSTVNIALSDAATPVTVANFLSYVRAGAYNNSFFHRAVSNFVVQGGGFALNGTADVPSDLSTGVTAIPTASAIQSETLSGGPNVMGTVAMALSGSLNDTATNQWFINLVDNSGNLDYQNGGFTVFGKVMGSGSNVANAIAALNVYAFPSPFDALPLGGNRAAGDVTDLIPQSQFVVIQSAAVVPALTYSASSSNPAVVAVTTGTASNHLLSLSYGGTGSATVTVTATDLDGNATAASFNVIAEPPATPLVAFASGSMTVSGTCGSALLQVVCTGALSGTSNVQFQTVDGTALSGTNSAYTGTSGTLTFTASGTVQTISIPITSSTVALPGLTFSVQLSATDGTTLATGTTATVTISDAGILQLSSTNYSADFGTGPLQVQVTRTSGSAGALSAVISTQDDTAKTGTDYTGVTQLVTFANGDASPKSVSIPLGSVVGTGQTKNFTISLLPAGGSVLGDKVSATAALTDDWEVKFLSPGYRVSRSDTTAVLIVQRTGTAAGVSVPFTTGTGTAVSGSDYTATSGTVVFPAGVTTREIQIPLLNGTSALERSFTVSLTGSVTGNTAIAPNQQTTTVSIEPSATSSNGVFTFDASTYRVDGNANARAFITIDRSVATGTAAAFVELVDGTSADASAAVFGQDYTAYAISGSTLSSRLVEVDFADGISSQSFFLSGISTGVKSLSASLINTSTGVIGTPSTTQITFYSTQGPAELIEFVESAYSANQSTGKAVITVMRGPSTTGTASIFCTTGTGTTARAGIDYVATSGRLTFLPGVATQDIEVPLKTTNSSGRTFQMVLSDPVGNAIIGGQNVVAVTITKSKPGNSIQFQQSSYKFDSTTSGFSQVAITNPAQLTGTAYVELIDGSAKLGNNYLAYNWDAQSQSFSSYQLSNNSSPAHVVPVTLNSGTSVAYLGLRELVNGTENLQLRLVGVSGSNVAIGTPNFTTVTVLDSATPGGLVYFTQPTYYADQSDGYAYVVVYRTETSGTVMFQCEPVNGTARAGVDFSFAPGTVNIIPPNSNYTVVPVKLLRNKAAKTASRSFTMKLTGVNPGSGALLAAENQSATVTIIEPNNPNGIFEFDSSSYSFSEDSGWAELVVVRNGGTAGAADLELSTQDSYSDYARGLLYNWFGQATTSLSTVAQQHLLPIHFEPGQDRQEVLIPLIGGTGNASLRSPLYFSAYLSNASGGIIGAKSQAMISDYASENLSTPSIEFASTQYRFNAASGTVSLRANLYYAGITTAAISVPFEITSDSADLLASLGTDYQPLSGGNVVLSGTTPVMDGTATVATAVYGTLTFPAGTTTVDLPIAVYSGKGTVNEKRFSVQLLSPASGATLLAQTMATVTIVPQNSTNGVFQMEKPAYSFYENCGFFTVNVIRSGGQGATSGTVFVTTENGSATGAVYNSYDYFGGYENFVSGGIYLRFSPNDTQKSFTVQVVDRSGSNQINSTNLRVRIESADAGSQIGGQDSALVTLLNQDTVTAPTLNFDKSAYEVDESGSNATFYITVDRVNLSGTADASGTLSIPYSISDGSAVVGGTIPDYAPVTGSAAVLSSTAVSSGTTLISGTAVVSNTTVTSGTLTFLPNVTSVQIPVTIGFHAASLPDRTFWVQLSATGAALDGTTSNVGIVGINPVPVTIHSAGLFEFDASSYTVDQASGFAMVPIIRSGTALLSSSVVLQTLDETAYTGFDYDGGRQVVTFAANESVSCVLIPILGRNAAERRFSVYLEPTATALVGAQNLAKVYLEPVPSVTASGTEPVVEFFQNGYELYDTGTLSAGVRFTAATSGTVSVPYSIIPVSASSTNFGPNYSFMTGAAWFTAASGTSAASGTTVVTGSGSVVKTTFASGTLPLALGAAITSGTLSLPVASGTSTVSGILNIPAMNNPSTGPLSPDRYFLLQLANPTGTGTTMGNTVVPALIHSTNNPHGVIEFASNTVVVNRRVPSTIVLNRLGSSSTSSAVTVTAVVDTSHQGETAVKGIDYAGSSWKATFGPGKSTAVIKFTPLATARSGKTLALHLEQPSGGATVTTWSERSYIVLTVK